MKNLIFSALITLCMLQMTSCSVCTHVSVADMGRSAEATIVPLENPTLYCVNNQWYMEGFKANVQRCNASSIQPELLPAENKHPERYILGNDEMEPLYSPIPADMAETIRKGVYTHSHAISFINRKWVNELPDGKVKKEEIKASTPDYFRSLSSHRLMHTDKGSFILAKIGELTADFSSIYAYPLAGICAIVIDAPASFLYSPPAQDSKVAQPEEVE